MKKIYIIISIALFLAVSICSVSFAVQKGGPASSGYPEIFPGTAESVMGINFGNDGGLQTTSTATSSVQVVFDGGGVPLEASDMDVVVPFKCTIQKVELLADTEGSITIKIQKSSYAGYPGSLTDLGSDIAMSSAQKINGDISDWTKSVDAGDILRIKVVSSTTIQRCLVSLRLLRTR